jgi:hypothetical protein
LRRAGFLFSEFTRAKHAAALIYFFRSLLLSAVFELRRR